MSQAAVEILKKYRKIVWSEAKKYLKDPSYSKHFSVPARYKKERNYHWRLVRDYPKRKGKYFRPTILLLTCEAMGGKAPYAIKTAAAMQISEDWLLIHDDFEDNSMERRGRPTLHRTYWPELAINAGDTLQIIMWKILADNLGKLGSQKADLIINEFYRILTRTTLGQSTEIKWSKENKLNFSDEDWFFIADGKTSYYTIAGPMRLGAIIAGATKDQLEKLTEFGVYLGRCYQLVDDILDVTSDFKGFKKQQGNDIYEGKRTVILGHLFRFANKRDKAKLASILMKTREQKTDKEVKWVIERMQHYGSIEYSKKLATKLKKKAQEIFQKKLIFLSRKPARSKLQALIDFVSERQY